MNKYIAWINGTSVAMGTKREVETKALAVIKSDRFKLWNEGKEVNLRITTYGSQLFVSSTQHKVS